MIDSFRTAAATTEQLVHDGRCLVYGLAPEIATSGTIKLRNRVTLVPLAPTNPVATGHATGGALAEATYYAKIVAVDKYGDQSGPSTEVNSGALAGVGVNSVDFAWDAMTNAVSYRIYFGTASGVLPKYFESTAASFTLTTTTGQLTATIPASGGISTTLHACAAALPQAGKQLGGVLFEKGLTVQLSNAADLTSVTWEAM